MLLNNLIPNYSKVVNKVYPSIKKTLRFFLFLCFQGGMLVRFIKNMVSNLSNFFMTRKYGAHSMAGRLIIGLVS